jgi:hypothetical protein
MSVPKIHRSLALVVLAGAVVQFFLGGLYAFGGDGVDVHRAIGSLLTLLALVAIVLAWRGRPEALQASAVLLGLLVLQHVLAITGAEVASVLGALHPVNGLLVLGAAMLAAAGRPVRPGHHRAGAQARRAT